MESCHVAFFIMEDGIDQKNIHDIMRIMVVNIGQHYFHNVYIRFAHIHIMKIMVTDIHDIFPQNGQNNKIEKNCLNESLDES